jgi:hypothetical protein
LIVFASNPVASDQVSSQFKTFLHGRKISCHLFTRRCSQCLRFARLFDRIRIFDDDCPHLVAPALENFLKSRFLFEPIIELVAPSFLAPRGLYTSHFSGNRTLIELSVLDGQSSVMFELTPRGEPRVNRLCVQFKVTGFREDGSQILRVLNFECQIDREVEKFDGVVFGCLLARQRASQSFFESPEAAYQRHEEVCTDLMTVWSAAGQYRRSIPRLFRDIPLMLFAIEVSDLFRSGISEIERTAAMINFMGLAVEELKRALYPIMALPPLNFPHRLQRATIGTFPLVIFIRSFDGVAVSMEGSPDSAEIQKYAAEYGVPITVYTGEAMLAANLIEERFITFPVFTQKLEVEINSARF